MCAQRSSNRLGRRGGGQNRGRPGIAEHRRQPLRVPGQGRREQRDRDPARVDRAEEGGHIVKAVWRQDRHPITGLGDLLQARADRTDPRPQLIPAELDDAPVLFFRVVDELVRRAVAVRGAVLIEKLGHRRVIRQDDRAVGKNVVVDVGHCWLSSTNQGGVLTHAQRIKGSLDRLLHHLVCYPSPFSAAVPHVCWVNRGRPLLGPAAVAT